jgi:outer membrane protein assembly factor BamE
MLWRRVENLASPGLKSAKRGVEKLNTVAEAVTATRDPMPIRSILTLLLSACLLGGCFLKPHKIDVQQGNYLDEVTVAKLKPGMTRSQVRFLLGTPLIADPFHPERWDYMYLDRKGGKLKNEKRLTLYFDGDKLTRAVTDLPVAGISDATKSAASAR